ncbi:MAG: hypothetical protein QOH46_2885 [Solirubrobacteraceae bacterium]|jgi:uncharacterized membrane protein YkoI|nr:hypothetical protein [Solirubrobacteraceae bacterium]
MLNAARKTVTTVAAIGALALGGSALADAATKSSSSGSTTTTATTGQAAQGYGPGGNAPAGPHVGANGKQEQTLTGDTADKVGKAALAKVPGTVVRVETDVDHGSPYEAHIRKSDGTEVEVLVDKDFAVTAVNDMRRP